MPLLYVLQFGSNDEEDDDDEDDKDEIGFNDED